MEGFSYSNLGVHLRLKIPYYLNSKYHHLSLKNIYWKGNNGWMLVCKYEFNAYDNLFLSLFTNKDINDYCF